ncbi:hypothetical protein H5410_055846 [Solanum commersonii]|uniref:Uncharacterized protein n=1 Tax=Solanum commersonii TaxID=4109 RepID=A0A9J5WL07_SOLCO|nr:hypothetical protein H5410_055846 [Solanum commersonii]
MECQFSDEPQETDGKVRIDTQVILKRGSFKYLGSIIQKNGDGTSYFSRMDEMEARLVTYVIKMCHQDLKGKFYRVLVRPAMLHGLNVGSSRTLTFRFPKRKIAKIRMYEQTRRDKIRNEDILDKVGVTSVADKMREVRLRWFMHVKRRSTDAQ